MPKTINVNADGIDAAGNSYDIIATEEAVAAGFVVNHPVRLRYPDGGTVSATEIRVTPKGIAALREMGGAS